jgi:large subunit ribosomal protein L15
MQTNTLKRKTENKKRKLIGRGGKRGKTSGRGTKGQWAHGGHGVRPELRDIIKKFPKLRGHGKNRARTVNSARVKPVVVNIAVLEDNFKDGDTVTVETLLAKGLVKKSGGQTPTVKILAGGVVKKKLKLVKLLTSITGKVAIEKAGGSVK